MRYTRTTILACVSWLLLDTDSFAQSKSVVGNFVADAKVWRQKDDVLLAQGGMNWSYALFDQNIPQDAAIEAVVTIGKPCPRQGPGHADWFRYTIQREDPGYDACLILRSFGSGLTESWWYRVQLSTRYQEIALHKGNGGYVKVVPAEIAVNKPLRLKAEARGGRIRVWLAAKLVLEYDDQVAPILGQGGKWGVGSFEATVSFRDAKILPASQEALLVMPERKHQMSFRTWHGSSWIFSDDEPIARFAGGELVEMKLLPGYQPQLHAILLWMEADQQPKAPEEIKAVGPAENVAELAVRVRGRTTFPPTQNHNTIRVGFDRDRGTYYYDFEGAALLNTKDPKFSQVTNLQYNWLMPYSGSPNAWLGWVFDPARHMELGKLPLPANIVRGDDAAYYHWELFHGKDGVLYRVPLRNDWDSCPSTHLRRIYGGGANSLKPDVSAGRTWARGLHPVCNPAVTFLHKDAGLEANCSVCAFSHETHLAWQFQPHNLKTPEIKAHYRFHGNLPAALAKVFLTSRLPSLPELQRTAILHKSGVNRFGPDQQNAVADPLVSVSWRGAYDVDKKIGFDDSYSLVLDSAGWAEFKPLPAKAPPEGTGFGYPPADRYLLTFMLKTMGISGRGPYLEIARDKETVRHYLGPVNLPQWQRAGLVTRLLSKPGAARVRLGLDGGGRAWIDNVELRPLTEGEAVPKGVVEKAVPAVEPPAWVKSLPKGIVSAWALDETVGQMAYDWIGGRHMELTNPLWAERDGYKGLHLSPDFSEAFGNAPGDFQYPDLTLALWVRPDRGFGKPAYWGVTLLSLSRRINLGGAGQPTLWPNFTCPPERPLSQVKIGIKDGTCTLRASKPLTVGKWQHLAVTCQTTGKKLLERIYLNGELVAEGIYEGTIDRGANALTLGCDPYQRTDSRAYGMFRNVQVYTRALGAEEIGKLGTGRQ